MTSQQRIRSACDRCHAQKLRCPKQVGSIVCGRCSKAGARCRYSPPGTVSIESDRNDAAVMNGILAHEYDVSQTGPFVADFYDWNVLDPNHGDYTPATLEQSNLGLDNGACEALVISPLDMPATSIRNTARAGPHVETPRSELSCFQRLVNVVRDADSILADLPTEAELHLPRSNPIDVFNTILSERTTTTSSLEKFFTLAQELIDVYPAATEATVSRNPRGSTHICEALDCIHNVKLEEPLQKLEEQLANQSGIDLAMANLLVAAHTRLLDILDHIFMVFLSCTRVTKASCREPSFNTPDLHIGTFIPQRHGAVLVQVTLLEHLAARLTRQLACFGEAITSRAEKHPDDGSECTIFKLQHLLLTKSHLKKVSHVEVMEEFLVNFKPTKE